MVAARKDRASLIRTTTARLSTADGLSHSVRLAVSGEIPRMLSLSDFVDSANAKAGDSAHQAAERLKLRLERRVEQLVKREENGVVRQQPGRRSWAPPGAGRRPMSAAPRAKPSWASGGTAAASALRGEGVGHSGRRSVPYPRGGGGRIGRPGTSTRQPRARRSSAGGAGFHRGSRSALELTPMDTGDEDEDILAMWERTLHQPANGGGFPWSDENDTNGGGAGGAGGKGKSSDDIDSAVWSDEPPPLSPADVAAVRIVDAVNKNRPGGGAGARAGAGPRAAAASRTRSATAGDGQSESEIGLALVALAARIRPKWSTVVTALHDAAASDSCRE